MSAEAVTRLMQYIVIRGDLLQSLKWNKGAVITQACHACSAALWLYREDENTIAYTNELDHMHKVVLEVGWHDMYICLHLLQNFSNMPDCKIDSYPRVGTPGKI